MLVLILVLAMTVTIFADNVKITVTASADKYTEGGTLKLSFKADQPMGGGQMYIKYDNSVMTLEKLKHSNSEFDGTISKTDNGDFVTYMFNDLTSNEEVFTAYFTLKSGVSSADKLSISVSDVQMTSEKLTTEYLSDFGWSYSICRNHVWKLVDEDKATCTEDGKKEYKCSNCSATKTEKTADALGHKYKVSVVEPTCTEGGYTYNECERCSYTKKTDRVDPTGHDFQVVSTTTTCGKLGVTNYQCSKCTEVKFEHDTVTPEHSYKKETVESTCVSYGKDVYTCEICGHTYEERHNLYAEHKYKGTVTNPTCTEAGHTSFVCETCNHSYIDNITSATGHSFGEWKIEIAATTEQEGIAKRVCLGCNAVETKKIDKLISSAPGVVTEDTTWMMTLIIILVIGIVILLILLIVLYITFKKKREERRNTLGNTKPTTPDGGNSTGSGVSF